MQTEERAKRSSSGIFFGDLCEDRRTCEEIFIWHFFFLSAIFVKIEVREKGKVNKSFRLASI